MPPCSLPRDRSTRDGRHACIYVLALQPLRRVSSHAHRLLGAPAPCPASTYYALPHSPASRHLASTSRRPLSRWLLCAEAQQRRAEARCTRTASQPASKALRSREAPRARPSCEWPCRLREPACGHGESASVEQPFIPTDQHADHAGRNTRDASDARWTLTAAQSVIVLGFALRVFVL